jgi:site-specific DNA-adenine methylase
VWAALGEVTTYAEPFAGTAVVGLSCPYTVPNFYLNDANAHIANVFRSVMYDPDEVIFQACHPRLELDMWMIHDYLINGRAQFFVIADFNNYNQLHRGETKMKTQNLSMKRILKIAEENNCESEKLLKFCRRAKRALAPAESEKLLKSLPVLYK